MLIQGHDAGPKPRNSITVSQLPAYIDKQQPSPKREPFRTASQHVVCHTLSVVLPGDLDKENIDKIVQATDDVHWSKVYMKLIDIISGDFFEKYVKNGNILMLSEGRAGVDNCYTLIDGILRLEVDKATFESIGLQGKVIPSDGRKHVAARYAIELHLKDPSMVRGKKGFQRIVWAFENVLQTSITWLFVNLGAPSDFTGPIAAHAPVIRHCTPARSTTDGTMVPNMALDSMEEEELLELQEWTSLAMLGSPRITANDDINTYLCRYSVPAREDSATPTPITVLQWNAVITQAVIIKLLTTMLKPSTAPSWFALSAYAFDGRAYTIIKSASQVAVYSFQD